MPKSSVLAWIPHSYEKDTDASLTPSSVGMYDACTIQEGKGGTNSIKPQKDHAAAPCDCNCTCDSGDEGAFTVVVALSRSWFAISGGDCFCSYRGADFALVGWMFEWKGAGLSVASLVGELSVLLA